MYLYPNTKINYRINGNRSTTPSTSLKKVLKVCSTIGLTRIAEISQLVSCNQWLVGNSLSIADLAIAAQLSLLSFPASSGELLFEKGCPGFADNPQLTNLFEWRDAIEKNLMETDPATF